MERRKPLRLKTWDYSRDGIYFITICAKNRESIFGKISHISVGDGVLDVPIVHLSDIGKVVERQILIMDNVYPNLSMDKFCIMPNHVHLLIALQGGTSRTPSRTNETIPALISTLKRYTNRECGSSIWHRSYYDHIIRNEQDFQRIWRYIDTNPQKWEDDCYYKESD